MRFEAPTTIDGAVALLAAEDGLTRCLAGGTDVLVQLRSGMVEPDLIVDIKRIPGMDEIVEQDGGFRIGAGVPGAAMKEHKALLASWPGVVEAANLVGSTQVHNRATIAGNLCNGSPAADTVPAMIAADAVVRVHGPGGARDIAVADIPVGPGKTSIAKGEMVGSIFLPGRPAASGDCYLRFIPRTEMDIAVVGAAVSLVMDGDKVAEARVALGAVAPTCRLVPDAGAALVGRTVEEAAEDLAAAARAACAPIDDKRGTIEFRTKVAGTLAVRAARIAADRAKG
ncbi:MAG: xanthine dehydrogenase family protein subunit M [Pseudomonadota bacterium]